MRLNQFISYRPHTGINTSKFKGANLHRMSVFYLTDKDVHLEDMNDVCQEIRDKDYQVKINHSSHNISDRDMSKLIKSKGLINPIEKRQYQLSQNEYSSYRQMGIDPDAASWYDCWVHEKSFLKEYIEIIITNKHTQTSIEKKFRDGKVLESTKDAFNFELFTTTETVDQPIIFDDDVQDCIDRCGDMFEADDIDVSKRNSSLRVVLTKFIEIT